MSIQLDTGGRDLVFLPRHVETIASRLFALPDGFTVSAFRDEFGLARRHVVPSSSGSTQRD
jgi:hypothetical protein